MVLWCFRPIFIVFLLVKLTVCETDDDGVCDAPVADTCFTDVQDDLKLIFHPEDNVIDSQNGTSFVDLCDAWKDSLQCTRDIVDTTCTNEEGKERFDAWNEGLNRVIDLLCHDDMTNLKVIASTIECWNIITFFHCVENKTNLTSIEDLLKTPLSGDECDIIKYAFDDCHLVATNFGCPMYEVIRSNVATVIIELFNEIYCEEKPSDAITESIKQQNNSPDLNILPLFYLNIAIFVYRVIYM